jgi:hypothetical protein
VAAGLLGLRVRILSGELMSISLECCVLPGTAACDRADHPPRGVLLSVVCVCVYVCECMCVCECECCVLPGTAACDRADHPPRGVLLSVVCVCVCVSVVCCLVQLPATGPITRPEESY